MSDSTVFIASNGQPVTEDMLNRWCDALDRDEWPEGEHSVGDIIIGRPPMSPEGSVVMSFKVPPAMKRAVEQQARDEGLSTSEYLRSIVADRLVARTA